MEETSPTQFVGDASSILDINKKRHYLNEIMTFLNLLK